MSLELPAGQDEIVTVMALRDHGLVEMKPTGRFGLTGQGWELAKALRVLDEMYAEESGAPQTRRDVKRPQRTGRKGT